MATVVYCVVCDDVRVDPTNPVRIDIYGLLARMRSRATPPFPVRRPMFSVLIMLAEPDRYMDLEIRVIHDNTGDLVFQSATRPMIFPGSAAQVAPMLFRIRQCRFPTGGLYWVECWNGRRRLIRQRLYLEA